MKKRALSVRTSVLLTELIVGSSWIGVGISSLFENGLLSVTILLISLHCMFIPALLRKEKGDEMSRRHYEMACVTGYKVLGACIILLYLLDPFYQKESFMQLCAVGPIVFGLSIISVGLYFYYLEKRGEPCQS